MRWDIWSQIERALIDSGVKPILAVVPDNRDPVLAPAPAVRDFWGHVRRWQDLGWTISLHGYQHLYVVRDAGLVALRKTSEFASLPAKEQEEKLRIGTDIFAREGIKSRVWIAPGDSFDEVTASLLPKFGIDIISAGWFWKPFIGPHNMTWLPCQLSTFRSVPAGIWSVCHHHNEWTRLDLSRFQNDLVRYRKDILSMDEALAKCPPKRAHWRYHFCTSPRLSYFLVRAHLKIWKLTHKEDTADTAGNISEDAPWPRPVLVRSRPAR